MKNKQKKKPLMPIFKERLTDSDDDNVEGIAEAMALKQGGFPF
jgi:hypothetical protein